VGTEFFASTANTTINQFARFFKSDASALALISSNTRTDVFILHVSISNRRREKNAFVHSKMDHLIFFDEMVLIPLQFFPLWRDVSIAIYLIY